MSGDWNRTGTGHDPYALTRLARRSQFMTDEHGRKWHARLEGMSNEPTGPIQPRFDAPWYPPQIRHNGKSSLTVDPEDLRSLKIDYELILEQRLEAHRDYHQQAVEQAAAREWDIPKEGEAYDERLIKLIGPPPQPIEPVVAAMQGNSWILGFTTKPDPRLEKFVETRATKRQKFFNNLPDFSDAALEEMDEERMDLEEHYDREAVGSQTGRPVAKHTQKKKAPKNAQMKAAPPTDEAA